MNKFLKTAVFALFLVTAGASLAFAEDACPGNGCGETLRTISVTGRARIESPLNDSTILNANINVSIFGSPTMAEISQKDKDIQEIIKGKLDSLGAKYELTHSWMSINPVYGEANQITEYGMSHDYALTLTSGLDDLELAEAISSLNTESNVSITLNSVYKDMGPYDTAFFEESLTDADYQKLYDKAYGNALRKAQILAKLAGGKVGKITQVSEYIYIGDYYTKRYLNIELNATFELIKK